MTVPPEEAPEALPPDADDPLVGAPRDRSEGTAAVARDLLRGLIGPLLAILTALIVGALIIVFTDPTTLDAWGSFFSDPGTALSESWDLVATSYRALFDSSLGSQRALARTLVQRSDERRVGKECVSQCRSRWSRSH